MRKKLSLHIAFPVLLCSFLSCSGPGKETSESKVTQPPSVLAMETTKAQSESLRQENEQLKQQCEELIRESHQHHRAALYLYVGLPVPGFLSVADRRLEKSVGEDAVIRLKKEPPLKFHEISFQEDIGYVVGGLGALFYILDRNGIPMTRGHHELSLRNGGVWGKTGSRQALVIDRDGYLTGSQGSLYPLLPDPAMSLLPYQKPYPLSN